ncbi:MAG: flavin reductase [Flammeovirgaceae bacterium]
MTGSVTIITSNGEASKGGFTATAVCSVSDNPPTILVILDCINRKNESNELIKSNKVFAVNVLTNLNQELSNRFAGYDKEISLTQCLEKGNWTILKTGSPILENSLVSFDCILTEWQEVATHSIAFGEVVAIKHGENVSPLLYFDGAYKGF